MVRIRRVATSLGLCALLAGSQLAACGGGDEIATDPVSRADTIVEQALASDHEWLRAETVRLLGLLDDDVSRPELERALEDPSPVVQTAAVEALLHQGARSVEDSALSRMVSGTEEQRLQLLDLVVEVGRADFRGEMILRATRDLSPDVQVAALKHAIATNTALGPAELSRLIDDDDDDVSEAAFLTLVEFDRAAALDMVLRGLRSTDDDARARGMRFARHLASSSLWPMMRSYADQDDDLAARRLALVVLGYLGDPIAEQPLRDILLTADDEVAAEALAAVSHIPTQRAEDQPLVHRRDARRAVRAAALEQLIRQGRPTDDFEVFLEDSDPEIAERALLYMQYSDPERAAALFSRALADSDEPALALSALYRVSLHHDIRRFLDATSDRLLRMLASDDPEVTGLAARLLVTATSPTEMENRIRRTPSADARYALLEATFGAEGNFSDLYTRSLDDDIVAVRVAAALGILALGNEYQPPVETDS